MSRKEVILSSYINFDIRHISTGKSLFGCSIPLIMHRKVCIFRQGVFRKIQMISLSEDLYSETAANRRFPQTVPEKFFGTVIALLKHGFIIPQSKEEWHGREYYTSGIPKQIRSRAVE